MPSVLRPFLSSLSFSFPLYDLSLFLPSSLPSLRYNDRYHLLDDIISLWTEDADGNFLRLPRTRMHYNIHMGKRGREGGRRDKERDNERDKESSLSRATASSSSSLFSPLLPTSFSISPYFRPVPLSIALITLRILKSHSHHPPPPSPPSYHGPPSTHTRQQIPKY